MANEAFFATRSVPEQLRFLAQSVVNGQYVLRIRDEALVAHEAREDARARAMRRTLLSLGAARPCVRANVTRSRSSAGPAPGSGRSFRISRRLAGATRWRRQVRRGG